jgi:peptidyl-tRNA hydrolase
MKEINMTNDRDMTCYVLVRTDLPSLTPGKAMAQAHHAGVQMMAKYEERMKVQDYVNDGIAQGAVYFNTTIVLGATLTEILERGVAAEAAGDHVVVFNTVTDPSYPFFVENAEIADLIPESTAKVIKQMPDGRILMVREEVTCAWFLGDRNNPEFRALFDGLNLHA